MRAAWPMRTPLCEKRHGEKREIMRAGYLHVSWALGV